MAKRDKVGVGGRRIIQLYFGAEDALRELRSKYPELIEGLNSAVSPEQNNISSQHNRVASDSTPNDVRQLEIEEAIVKFKKNYIFVERPLKHNLTIQDKDRKSLRDRASVRALNEREEDSRFERALREKGINLRRFQFEYNEDLEPSVWLQREKDVLSEVSKYLKPDNFRANIHYVHICDGCKSSTPLVILHGVGGAIPAYHKLYSTSVPKYGRLFKDRCIYSMDMPGFGLSARVEFITESEIEEEREKLEKIEDKKERQKEIEKFESRIADECELKIVEEIEKWRVAMKIDKMILLGHSFGGYISTAYATRYSDHVEQLVLLDPWGILSTEDHYCPLTKETTIMKTLLTQFLKELCEWFKFDPFDYYSSSGIVQSISELFLRWTRDEEEGKSYEENGCLDYLIEIHQTENQTGLNAFCNISGFNFIYSITTIPMKERLLKLVNENSNLQVSFLLGEDSPYTECSKCWSEEMLGHSNLVKFAVEESGHHPNVQNPERVVELIYQHVYSH